MIGSAPFGGEPDVMASAAGRVNLLGEHTDYNSGYVLPTSIPQRTRVAMRIAEGPRSRVYSANLDALTQFGPGEPPPQQFALYVYGCIEQVRLRIRNVPPLDIWVESDVPMGVGLSSSAALEVAVLRALRELLELHIDDVVLAQIAQQAEIQHAGVNCGILDQMASSLIDSGAMLFLDTRTLERRLLPLPRGAQVLVLDSGVQRSLATSKYNERRSECEAAANALGVATLREADPSAIEHLPEPQRRRARHVVSENARVKRAVDADARGFGTLMNASHASLRDDYEVSHPALDALAALLQSDADVFGAKLTGAGFGGACVALCRTGAAEACAARVLDAYARAGYTGRKLVPA